MPTTKKTAPSTSLTVPIRNLNAETVGEANLPEDARKVADRFVCAPVDAGGQELVELCPLVVEHAERRVARPCELACGLEHPVEHDRQVEVGDQPPADVQQAAVPDLLGGIAH